MNPLDRPRILIVENEALVGCDMAASLSKLGYDVVGACISGEEALRIAADLQPDLVLLDIHLGGQLDGIETAKALQQTSTIGVVYVTACADLQTVARARETQPHGYLLKPFSEDELRTTVEVASARHRENIARSRREHSYFVALQSLADAVIVTDLAGIIIFMNPAAARVSGWAEGEVVGRSLHEVFRIYQTSGEPAEVMVLDETGAIPQRTVWLTTRGGDRVAIQDRTTALRDPHNSITGLIVLFRSLMPAAATEHLVSAPEGVIETQSYPPVHSQLLSEPALHPAAAALEQQAGDLKQPVVYSPAPLVDVVETISDPLIAMDGLWRISYANAAAAKLFAREKLAIMGTNFWELMPGVIRDAHYEALSHALLHRESLSRDFYLEAQNIWLELRAYPFGEGMLLLLKDITARHEEAEKRNRIDRLESLGLLARGFAHDFNNLLTVLLGNLSLAEMRLRGNTDRIPELTTAKQATLQAQNLVQQLLTFARGGAPIKRHIKPTELIEQFFQHHSRATHVQYRIEVQQGLPSIAVDPNQIRRLLGNLIRNAEQAMPQGGELVIRCLAPDPEELYGRDMLPDHGEQPQGVIIEVRDTGEGISPDHLPHVFEPYFSTRKAQNATGLGLTVCESIAKAHGGSLSVRSEHGYGTTVRFYLPVDADEEAAEELGIARNTVEPIVSAAPRILILEDDPLVRSLITRNLTSQGFEVTETPEGSETIRRYQEAMDQGRIYDLVVLDLTIPNGLGGVRTMERLRQLDPNVLAIVSSGYSDDPVMAKPAAYGFSAVLPKPYEPADLLRLVKSVLNARGMRSEKKA